jgi:Holliday junction DNA helicase RuvA
MSIFSFADRNGVVEAVIKGDVEFFTQVPRLGKKNAQKIIIELKNKLGDTSSLDLSGEDSAENNEIITALKTFGFSAKEAGDALKSIDKEAKTVEEKIKLALKYFGK